jgi:hypothetical protein
MVGNLCSVFTFSKSVSNSRVESGATIHVPSSTFLGVVGVELVIVSQYPLLVGTELTTY